MAIFVFILLVLLKSLYTYAGVSISSLNDVAVKKRAEDGDELFRKISKLRQDNRRFSQRMQAGSSLAGLAAGSYAGYRLGRWLLDLISLDSRFPWLGGFAAVLASLLAGVLVLVLGLHLPRQLALADSLKGSRRMIRFAGPLLAVASPFTGATRFLKSIFFRLFHVKEDDQQRITEEEIRMMVDVSRESGNIAISEKEMIENIFEFNDKTAEEIMTHRTQIVGIEARATLSETIKIMLEENYSRLPVYNERLDDVIGVLHIKDLLRYISEGSSQQFNIMDLARPPYFAPQSKTVDSLFKEMQLKHHRLAIIIDEYGGTAGMVTLEDILEEIVGNLQDEYDEEPQDVTSMPDGSYIIQASADLEGLEKQIPGITFTDEEKESYDTLAGLMIDRLGRIPDSKEYPEILNSNYHLKVISMDERRIEQVRLWILEEASDESQHEKE